VRKPLRGDHRRIVRPMLEQPARILQQVRQMSAL
jgi:hypothetical protein